MPDGNRKNISLLQCVTNFNKICTQKPSDHLLPSKRTPGIVLQPQQSSRKKPRASLGKGKKQVKSAELPANHQSSVQACTGQAEQDRTRDQGTDAAKKQHDEPAGRDQSKDASTSGRPGVVEGTFYSKWRLGEVERCVLRLLATARRKLRGSTADPYIVFPLQEPAFQWADDHPDAPDIRIFSSERGPEGKRVFIATTLDGFWKRYRDMLPPHRHCYEIIRQGYPCHLYFDLEYCKEFNEGVDGNVLVDIVLKLCAECLKEKFQLVLEDSWVLELDSSSPHKFSRHIIVRIPGTAFQNNFHVGAFVKDMCAAQESIDPDNPVQQLLINKDGEGTKALFVDGGVYTRNRAFRLFLSSKAGKEWILQPTERFQGAKLSHRDIFFVSLICNVSEDCRLLRCYEDADGTPFSWVRHGQNGGRARDTQAAIERCAQPQIGPSRHPDIERFITSVCAMGGVQGEVRSWVEWPEAGLLLLNMKYNRWCGNIGRAHRSNGTFYVISLQEGAWYQKCYDPECRGYRSDMMPLPKEIVARLHAHNQHAAGSNAQLGIFEGMQEDEACDGELMSMLDACEARLRAGKSCQT